MSDTDKDPGQHWFYTTMRALMRTTIGRLFPVRASGVDSVPPRGGVLVVSNHESYLDPIAVGITLERPASYLARSSLFRWFPMRWLLRGLNAIPLEREGVGKEGIRASIDNLKQGRVLAIWPEGTRTEDGKMSPLKAGILLLARRAKCPVVVAGIAGSFESWPRGRLLPRRHPVWVHYQAWSYDDQRTDAENLEALRNAITEAVGSARASLEGKPSPPLAR